MTGHFHNTVQRWGIALFYNPSWNNRAGGVSEYSGFEDESPSALTPQKCVRAISLISKVRTGLHKDDTLSEPTQAREGGECPPLWKMPNHNFGQFLFGAQ